MKLGYCWGWGKHSFWPARWSRCRRRWERECTRCHAREEAPTPKR